MQTRTFRLERRRDLDGNTLYFIIPSRDRRKRPKFFRPADVPHFEGDEAWFEIETGRKPWKVLRRVDG